MFLTGTARPLALDRTPDEALLRFAVQGNGHAFAVLVERHGRRATAAARAILGSASAAEDAVQEALVQLWRSASSYTPDRGSVRAYLLVLVRSRALDQLRRENVRAAAAQRATEALRTTRADTGDEVERRAETRAMCDGIVGLPREQAQVLGLQFLAGRSQSEVASLLDVPLGTVKGRTRLGLARLRRELTVAA